MNSPAIPNADKNTIASNEKLAQSKMDAIVTKSFVHSLGAKGIPEEEIKSWQR